MNDKPLEAQSAELTGHNGEARRIGVNEPAKAMAIIHPEVAIADVKSLYTLMKDLYHQVLIKDIDYGIIPGTGDKPTLLLPGMEKICRALRAVPEYIETNVTRDFDKPLFSFEYECRLVDAVTGISLPGGVGKGTCNSMESAFRWRQANRVCPICGQEAIIKGKQDYGGGWLCFAKKGGCGTKFRDGDERIEAQKTGRVENPDIYDQVNAILKRAKKRALGDAVKGAAAVSEFFTVDLEDMHTFTETIVIPDFTEPAPSITPPPAEKPAKSQTPKPAEKPAEPKASTSNTLDTKRLKDAIVFMYPDDSGEFHRNGTIKNLMADGTLTTDMPGHKAIETIILHRAFKDFVMDEPMVFRALTIAMDNGLSITSFEVWNKEHPGFGAYPLAWQAIIDYHENANLPPAGQDNAEPKPEEETDIPF